MPYSITTKDGITINNIPDGVAPDSPDLKARVAAIRAGNAPAAPASAPASAMAAPAPAAAPASAMAAPAAPPPAPPPAPPASPAVLAASAQVTPTQQAGRDQDTNKILIQELTSTKTKLASGAPASLPLEEQKAYIKRLQADEISLKRELAQKGVNVGALPAPAAAASSPIAAPAAPLPAPAPPAPAAQPQMGFFEGLAEQVTGSRRATPETQALPEWTSMPELNQMSVASFKTALGSLMSNPKETVQILQANFPSVQVRQDAKGNYILRSSVNQKEYAIPPGLTMGDLPRALGGIAAFTPAGRAVTIPGAIAAGAGTQAAIEASQAATGGGTGLADVGEVALAGALGPAGQILQRVGAPVVQAVKSGAQRVMARPAPAPAPVRVEPTFETPFVTPEAPPVAPTAAATPPVTPAAAPTATTTVTTEVVNNLVQKASGTGFGAAAARNKLADLAQINVGAKEAADRLGIKLPADVFSDSPQVRAAAGLTRSAAASESEAAWRTTVSQAVEKADEVIRQFDATFVEGAVAPGVVSQKIKDSLTATRSDLNAQASKIYNSVDEVVPKTSVVELPKLQEILASVKAEVGEKGMSSAERNLAKMIEEGNVTYGRLKREKTLIGKAIDKLESPYGSMAEADLKRLYAALADDQLTNVGNIGGEELRKQLRAANLIYAKERALGQRIVNAFGNDLEGSVANKMRTAITGAAKGDAGEFNRLLKAVPEDLRKETIATALASVTRSARGAEKGGFGFSEFADIYPKLRANPPVYKTIVETLGKDSANVLRDLYEVSKRVTEARANVLTTGKANQAFANPEGLIGKVMDSTITQRIVTTVTGLVPGGGAVAPDIIKFMSTGAEERVKAAGKLFADEAFQKLAVEAATKPAPSAAALRRTAMSQSFQNFADAARLPKSLDARVQWLQSAAQAGRQSTQENQ